MASRSRLPSGSRANQALARYRQDYPKAGQAGPSARRWTRSRFGHNVCGEGRAVGSPENIRACLEDHILQSVDNRAFPVYVVDDDEVVAESIAFLLSTAGIDSRRFDDGRAFLDKLPGLAAGCILLDLVMPQVNGIDVMRQLLATGCTMPVVLMTAAANTSAMRMSAGVSPHRFLEKPFDEDSLFAALEDGFAMLAQRAPASHGTRSQAVVAQLPAHQQVMLRGLIAGMGTAAVAAYLGISMVRARRMHLALREQIGAKDVYHAAAIGKQAGLQPLRIKEDWKSD